MNRELEKLVQQYADLYPYHSQPELPPPRQEAILSAPTNAPPAESINIPVEQRPPILNPIARDLQLLPVSPAVRTLDTDRIKQQVESRNRIADLFCGENLYRLVLVAIVFICLVTYFRKK